jgi:hypothetical protein
MKCHECDQEATWIVTDQSPYEDLFLPLCEEHFQELRGMEGEMNLDFDLIANLSLEDIVTKTNEKWKYMNSKYRNVLDRYSKLKGMLRNRPKRIKAQSHYDEYPELTEEYLQQMEAVMQ